MDYAQLGRTGLKVSRLCLGTMNFGPHTTEEDSYRIMDRALEVGLNFFDTANVYGWKIGEGITENIIGRYLAQGGGRREKIVLATKVYGEMGKWPNENRLSALNIRRACDASTRSGVSWCSASQRATCGAAAWPRAASGRSRSASSGWSQLDLA